MVVIGYCCIKQLALYIDALWCVAEFENGTPIGRTSISSNMVPPQVAVSESAESCTELLAVVQPAQSALPLPLRCTRLTGGTGWLAWATSATDSAARFNRPESKARRVLRFADMAPLPPGGIADTKRTSG